MAEYVNIKTGAVDKNVPTKETFKTELDKKFDVAGGNITGDINMNNNAIHNISKLQIRDQSGSTNITGVNIESKSTSATDGVLSLSTTNDNVTDTTVLIAGVHTPASGDHAANKAYVDEKVASVGMQHPIILEENTDYGDELPVNPAEGQLFFQNATSGLSIAEGGTGAITAEEAIANLGGLPLTGGTMVDSGSGRGRINIPGISSEWATARDLAGIKITPQGGSYTPALSMKSTNCTWDIATYNNNLEITKFLDTTYEAGANTPEKEYTFRNDGIVGLQTTVQLATGTVNSSTSLYSSGDLKLYKNIIVLLGESLSSANQYYSFIAPYKADQWGIYLPSSSDYYRARLNIDSSGGVRVTMLSSVTRVCYIYASL